MRCNVLTVGIKNGGDTFLQNVVKTSARLQESQPRRQESKLTEFQEDHNWQIVDWWL
jgi:hypothetical protein